MVCSLSFNVTKTFTRIYLACLAALNLTNAAPKRLIHNGASRFCNTSRKSESWESPVSTKSQWCDPKHVNDKHFLKVWKHCAQFKDPSTFWPQLFCRKVLLFCGFSPCFCLCCVLAFPKTALCSWQRKKLSPKKDSWVFFFCENAWIQQGVRSTCWPFAQNKCAHDREHTLNRYSEMSVERHLAHQNPKKAWQKASLAVCTSDGQRCTRVECRTEYSAPMFALHSCFSRRPESWMNLQNLIEFFFCLWIKQSGIPAWGS